MILSNNHVLANVNKASIGDNSLQPGPFDGGTDPADAIGTLAQFIPLDFNGGTNAVDAAIALTTESQVTNGTLPSLGGYGIPSTDPIAAVSLLDVVDGVEKCGRTTGCRTGTVTTVSLNVSVCYQTAGPFRCKKAALFTNQIGITDGTSGIFSAGGDSGSLIVDTEGDPNPVGLLFAGSSTMTIANDIGAVLDALGVTMYSGTVTSSTNQAPVLDLVGDKTVDELDLLTFTAEASDPDAGDVLTFSLTGAPPGASIDSGTGVFTWTPTEAQGPGSYDFDVVVTDNGNLKDQERITVTVNEVSEAPDGVTVTLTDAGSMNQDRNWVGQVQIGFTGVSSVTLSWSTGDGGTCTSQPCEVATTGDLRKSVSSSTLTIVDPTAFSGPSKITVTKP